MCRIHWIITPYPSDTQQAAVLSYGREEDFWWNTDRRSPLYTIGHSRRRPTAGNFQVGW